MKAWLASKLRAWLAPELAEAQRVYAAQIGIDFACDYIAWRQGGHTPHTSINEPATLALEYERQRRAHAKATGTLHGFAPNWKVIRRAR